MDARPTDIGEVLVSKGMINRGQLANARQVQARMHGDIAGILVQLGYANEGQIARGRAILHDLPFIDLHKTVLDTSLLHSVSKLYLFKHLVLPVEKRGPDTLVLAVADPVTAIPVRRRFEDAMHVNVSLAVAVKSVLVDRLVRLYGTELMHE